jgi:type II secretory pathway pseudopilin PulG
MVAGRQGHAVGKPVRAPGHVPDQGSSLIEFMVAIAVISIVMSALTSFFVTAVSTTSAQSGKQVAVQLADDAVERVRAIQGAAVAVGRDQTSADDQWAHPVVGVTSYLATMQETWDATAAYPAGATAPLPTTARSVSVNGISFDENWYVGKCWQPPAGGACAATQTGGYTEFFSVVVAVTWSERHCTANTCSYVMSTLVNDAGSEPVFGSGPAASPPVPTNPGNQLGELTVAANLQLSTVGGTAPLTWSGIGLPTGLSVSSTGLITGTPTATGVFNVVMTITDAAALSGTASFTWTVSALPTLTNPGHQTNGVGDVVSLTIAVSGGTGPLAWSVTRPGAWGATGLPPGLSINGSTGVISGAPTTQGPAQDMTVTVTDRFGKTASTTFKWTVHP